MNDFKILTERLTIRELQNSDYSNFCKLIQDEELMYLYGGAATDEVANNFFCEQINNYTELGFGLWACILNGTNEMIGLCGLQRRHIKTDDNVEVGFVFGKKYLEQGLEAEAINACIDFALKTLDVPEVFLVIHTDDIVGQNIAKQISIKKTGTGKRGNGANFDVYSVKNENRFFLRINYSTDPDNPDYSNEMIFYKEEKEKNGK